MAKLLDRNLEGVMQNDVMGSWRLQSFHMHDVETEQRSEPFGPAPRGTLILHPDGRMAAMIAPRDRTVAPQSFVAYSGRYRLEPPDRLVTAVDVSWIEAWVGTDQVRSYALEGDRLELSTPAGRMPRQDGGEMTVMGRIVWVREGSAQDASSHQI